MDYIKQFYNATATHNYIFGVLQGGRVKIYFVTLNLDGYRIIFNEKPTHAKRQVIIKYRSTKDKIKYLERYALKTIDFISESELKAARRTRINKNGQSYQENCGDCLEWLLSKAFNTKQNAKSNLKHTKGGDLIIDGVPWQVKYEKGGITVEG